MDEESKNVLNGQKEDQGRTEKRSFFGVKRVPMGKNYHGTTVMLPAPNYDHKSMEVGLKKEPEGGTEDGRVISWKTG